MVQFSLYLVDLHIGIFYICVYFIHTYFKNKKVYKEMDFLSSYGNHESFGSQSH